MVEIEKLTCQKERICGGCKHFIQHYRKANHCTYPMLKQRVKGETCPRWEARE